MKCFLGIMVYTLFQLYDGISPRALRSGSPTKLLMVQRRWRGKGNKMKCKFHIHSSGLSKRDKSEYMFLLCSEPGNEIRQCTTYIFISPSLSSLETPAEELCELSVGYSTDHQHFLPSQENFFANPICLYICIFSGSSSTATNFLFFIAKHAYQSRELRRPYKMHQICYKEKL